MPRNAKTILASRSIEQLAAEYVMRMRDTNPPVKLFSTSDIFEEMKSRIGIEEVKIYVKKADDIYQMCGGSNDT